MESPCILFRKKFSPLPLIFLPSVFSLLDSEISYVSFPMQIFFVVASFSLPALYYFVLLEVDHFPSYLSAAFHFFLQVLRFQCQKLPKRLYFFSSQVQSFPSDMHLLLSHLLWINEEDSLSLFFVHHILLIVLALI